MHPYDRKENLPADFPVDWEGPEPVLADRSSICPLCELFIAKNSSWIVRLPMAIRPLTLDGKRCVLNNRRYYWDNRYIRMTPRRWVHWYCWPERNERMRQARELGWSM